MRKVRTVMRFLRFQHSVRAGTWKRAAIVGAAITALWCGCPDLVVRADSVTGNDQIEENAGSAEELEENDMELNQGATEDSAAESIGEPTDEAYNSMISNAIGGLGGKTCVSGTTPIITQIGYENGIFASKTLENSSSGESLQVTLENYTIGKTTKDTYPADIVLLMDLSGSMKRKFDNHGKNIIALKTAAISFIDQLVQQNEGLTQEEQIRLALVKYSDTDKTEKLSDLVPVSGTSAETLKKIINGFDEDTPGGKTNMDTALERARDILNKQNRSGRVKAVILFTDGVPAPDAIEQDGFVMETANRTLKIAKELKDQGVLIYGFSIEGRADSSLPSVPTYEKNDFGYYIAEYHDLKKYGFPITTTDSNAVNLENRFMFLLTSDNPHAISMDIPNKENNSDPGQVHAPDGNNYYFTAKNTEELQNIFKNAAETIVQTASDLGAETEVRDFITSDFELADSDDVKIYIADYLGNGTWRDKKGWEDVTSQINEKVIKDKNYVKVSGFDFKENYVSDFSDGGYCGKKLIITFSIKPKRTFGGNEIATNQVGSGVYKSTLEDSDSAVLYPVPFADLQLNYEILAEDRKVYVPDRADLTQIVPFAADHTPDGDLNRYVDIKYVVTDPQGAEVGTLLIPAGEKAENCKWDWTESSASRCGTYQVDCEITPLEKGHYDIAQLKDQATVHILHPRIVFQDSVQHNGEIVDTAVRENKLADKEEMGPHLKSLMWICPDGENVPESTDTPVIKYMVSIPAGVEKVTGQEAQRRIITTNDIPVVVGIFRTSGYTDPVDLTEQTEFIQECGLVDNCGYPGVKDKGDPAGARFLIHVSDNMIPVLPSTGGNGTKGFLAASIAMASMLMILRAYQQIHRNKS